MLRTIAVSAIAAGLLCSLPAFSQEVPELEGAPTVFPKAPPLPPLKAPPPAPKTAAKPAAKPASPPATPSVKPAQPASPAQQAATSLDKLKADQAKLIEQADAQKAEQSRLAQIAADLKAREAKLEARAAELNAQEQRLAEVRSEQEADRATQLAEIDRLRTTPRSAPAPGPAEASTETETAAVDPEPAPRSLDTRRSIPARLDFDAAQRSCTEAGEDAAWARRFDRASYEGEPRVFNEEGWELRGRMRLEDRRGYVVVNTVCEVDADGEVQHFTLLR